MDLAKMIAEMKVELQCLDMAIASIEELARIQNVSFPDTLPAMPAEPEGVPSAQPGVDTVPVKRRRGRPRKRQPQDSDDSSISAA